MSILYLASPTWSFLVWARSLRSMAAFGMGIQPAGKVVYPEPGRNTGLRSCRPIANGANGTAACCAHWVGMSWLSGNAKPAIRPNYKLGCEDFWVRSNCEHKAVFLRRSRLRPCPCVFRREAARIVRPSRLPGHLSKQPLPKPSECCQAHLSGSRRGAISSHFRSPSIGVSIRVLPKALWALDGSRICVGLPRMRVVWTRNARFRAEPPAVVR